VGTAQGGNPGRTRIRRERQGSCSVGRSVAGVVMPDHCREKNYRGKKLG
jgi:hypothetical protein